MHGALFVSHQHVLDVRFGQGIVNVDDSPSRKTEKGIHIFIFKNFHQYLGTGQFHFFPFGQKKTVISRLGLITVFAFCLLDKVMPLSTLSPRQW
jgi:hypothetical protein